MILSISIEANYYAKWKSVANLIPILNAVIITYADNTFRKTMLLSHPIKDYMTRRVRATRRAVDSVCEYLMPIGSRLARLFYFHLLLCFAAENQ